MNDILERDYHVYFDGPYLGDGRRCYPFLLLLPRKVLFGLKKAIEATMDRYDELGWDDDDIRRQNTQSIDKYEEDLRRKSKIKKTKEKALDTRNLYLIHNAARNTLKIGISANPKARLHTLQVSSGDKLTLLFDIKGKAFLEKELHKEFADLRLQSEWFRYNKKIIDRFTSLQWD